jgi:hypothetical protein
MPQFVAAGTVAVGTTGTITPTFPAGIAAFDVLFTVAESVGGSSYAVPAGWAQVTNSPVVQGTNTQLTVMWLRYTGSEVAQGLTGPTDHKIARTVAVRGLPRTGNPWNVLGTAVSAVSNTSASWPGATPTPTAVNTLVLEIIATGVDPTADDTAGIDALTNATYTAITERVDNRTASGGGGSIAVISGAKATAAATGASTATLTTAATKAYMTLVLPDAPLPRPMRPPQVISQAVFRAANW